MEVDVLEEIKKICPPNGVQFALDCSGVPKVIETMIDSLGMRGRACSVGAPPPGKRASVDVFSHLVMGRQYVGCHQGESITREASNQDLFHLVLRDPGRIKLTYCLFVLDGSLSG